MGRLYTAAGLPAWHKARQGQHVPLHPSSAIACLARLLICRRSVDEEEWREEERVGGWEGVETGALCACQSDESLVCASALFPAET